MILGILAAVAAPKLLDTSSNASDNGIRQTLAIVRDAIERYAAENGGTLPGDLLTQADFTADLKEFIRGPFPTCPVAKKDNSVKVSNDNSGTPIVGEAGPVFSASWHYNFATGEFIVNSTATTNNDDDLATLQYDQL
jgi:general secretion pathway protein G